MRSLPVHPLYQKLEPFLPATGSALEIGAGVGTGVRFLLDHGLTVTAIDAEAEAVATMRERVPEAKIFEGLMQDFAFEPDSFDVIVAGFSLFFLAADELEALWPKLVASLRPGGLFMGQLLGRRDAWAEGYLAHSREEVEGLINGFDLLDFEEVERQGKTSQGPEKYWHVFHIVARKAG